MSGGRGVRLEMEVREDTGLFEFLESSPKEPVACEHSQHGVLDRFHEGNAQWVYMPNCPKCGGMGRVLSVCDRWKRHVTEAGILWHNPDIGGCNEVYDVTRATFVRL